MKKLWNYITGKTERLYREDLRKKLAVIDRKMARIQPAYDLQAQVVMYYGIEYLPYFTDPEQIIEDDKAITMINYFDVSCLKFTE